MRFKVAMVAGLLSAAARMACGEEAAATQAASKYRPEFVRMGAASLFIPVKEEYFNAQGLTHHRLSKDGHILAFTYGPRAFVMETRTGKLLWEGGDQERPAGDLILSPDGRWVACSTFYTKPPNRTRIVSAFDVEKGRVAFSRSFDTWSVFAPVGFSKDGESFLYRSDAEESIVKVNLATGDETSRWNVQQWQHEPIMSDGLGHRFYFSPDGQWAVHNEGLYRSDGTFVGTMGRRTQTWDCVFEKNAIVRTVSKEGIINGWDLSQNKALPTVEPTEWLGAFVDPKFVPGTNTILFQNGNKTGFMDAENGKMLGATDPIPESVKSRLQMPMAGVAEVSADGQMALVIASDGHKQALVVVPTPTLNHARAARREVSATQKITRDRPLAIPAHQTADLGRPDWWVERSLAEWADSPVQQFYVYTSYAAALASAGEYERAEKALASADGIAKKAATAEGAQTPPMGWEAAAKDAHEQLRLRRERPGEPWNPRETVQRRREGATSQKASEVDVVRMRELRLSKKFETYEAMRRPFVEAVKNAEGGPSRRMALIHLAVIDAMSGNMGEVEKAVQQPEMRDTGVGQLYIMACEEAGAAGDDDGVREVGASAARVFPRGARLVVRPAVLYQVVDGQLETMLSWIHDLPSQELRGSGYAYAAEVLAVCEATGEKK